MSGRPGVDDDDFNYDDDVYAGGASTMPGKATAVQNQHHDEEVALSESESFAAGDEPPKMPKGVLSPAGGASNLSDSYDYDAHIATSLSSPDTAAALAPALSPAAFAADTATRSTAQDRATACSSSPGAAQPAAAGSAAGVTSPAPGAALAPGSLPEYNALEYRNLPVPQDVQDLFTFIGQYTPQQIDLEMRLKPFLPDYVPAIGGCDEFIKVPRPDGRPDFLGLKVLDEPAAKQSDPTLLNLQLRQLAKELPAAAGGSQQGAEDAVGRIERCDASVARRIDQWVASVSELSRGGPAAGGGGYRRPMPDVEALMQEWPAEVEAGLRELTLPGAQLDLHLPDLGRAFCAVLDIPVYEDPIESLHLLFSTLLEFRSNPFFGAQAGGASLAGPGHTAAVRVGTPSGSLAGAARPWSEGGAPLQQAQGSGASRGGGLCGPGPLQGASSRALSRMMSSASSASGGAAASAAPGITVMAC